MFPNKVLYISDIEKRLRIQKESLMKEYLLTKDYSQQLKTNDSLIQQIKSKPISEIEKASFHIPYFQIKTYFS